MASMITNLREVAHDTIPGRTIDVRSFKINNYRIHNSLDALARLILSTMENESNNMQAELVPLNVSSMQLAWATVKETWDDAIKHNNPPTPAHEFGYKIFLPTGQEIMKMPNFKMKMMVKEYKHLAEIMLSTDSANSNANISIGTENKIKSAIKIVDELMLKWIGSGKDNASVGLDVPTFLHLGTLDPDVDADYAQVSEPSPDAPAHGRPDVADVTQPSGD